MIQKLKKPAQPTPLSKRAGCKVGWETFRTMQEAKVRAARAREQAAKLEAMGYDWGYQVPGNIRKTDDGYEVTVP